LFFLACIKENIITAITINSLKTVTIVDAMGGIRLVIFLYVNISVAKYKKGSNIKTAIYLFFKNTISLNIEITVVHPAVKFPSII
jgi:hypothetical protein